MELSALTFWLSFFFQIETKEVQKLKTESPSRVVSVQKKYHETDNIKMIPTKVKSDSSKSTTTEWFLIHLFKDKSSFAMFSPSFSTLLKDGAYYCYCAYVLRIYRYSDFLSPMFTNTGIFLRGLKLSGESRS